MKKVLTVATVGLGVVLAGAAAVAQQPPEAPVISADWHGEGWRGWWRGDDGERRGPPHGRGERGGKHRHHERAEHGGRGRGRGRMMERLAVFDTNGDGIVTQEEVNAFRQAQITRFDADGNGTLSLEEYQALWLDAMRERMVDAFQAHDDDGDGEVTFEEFNERFARMVERLDRDGDGAVELRPRRPGTAPADAAPADEDADDGDSEGNTL